MIHRHLDVSPDTPVGEHPLAALHDLLERGDLDDWRPLLLEIQQRPTGETARAVERLVDVYPMYGTSPLIRAWLERCRHRSPPGEPRSPRPEHQSLAELRHSRGKSQKQVASALGISQSDVSKLERRRDVRVSTLRSLARALGGVLSLRVELPDRVVELDIGPKKGPGKGTVKRG